MFGARAVGTEVPGSTARVLNFGAPENSHYAQNSANSLLIVGHAGYDAPLHLTVPETSPTLVFSRFNAMSMQRNTLLNKGFQIRKRKMEKDNKSEPKLFRVLDKNGQVIAEAKFSHWLKTADWMTVVTKGHRTWILQELVHGQWVMREKAGTP